MKGVMVGYGDMGGTKAYRIFVPELGKIIITPDVTFMDFKITTTIKVIERNTKPKKKLESESDKPDKTILEPNLENRINPNSKTNVQVNTGKEKFRTN